MKEELKGLKLNEADLKMVKEKLIE